MKDELKYPRVYALLEMKKAYIKYNHFEEIVGYLVSPCYLVSETVLYDKEGISKKTYEVVFPRDVGDIYFDCGDKENIPHIAYGECYNAVITDFVTLDYEEAVKKRDEKIREKVFNSINLFFALEPSETYNDRCSEYMEKINLYQEVLNKIEPKEQVKCKIKMPENK